MGTETDAALWERYILSGQIIMISECMNLCMGGVQPAWPRGRDMGSWLACLLVELLIKGTVCILAFYYIGYTPSGQIIMHSEIIMIWPLGVNERASWFSIPRNSHHKHGDTYKLMLPPNIASH